MLWTPDRPLIVYVAGSSKELPRVRGWMDRLKAHPNIAVAHDWTRVAGFENDAALTEEEATDAAQDDLSALRTAHVLWWLYPSEPSTGVGGAVEFGYMLGRFDYGSQRNQPVLYVSGASVGSSVFTSVAHVTDTSDEEVCRRVTATAQTLHAAGL